MMLRMLVAICLFCGLGTTADAARLKDVASLYGVRTNALTGYGIVTGLNRSGDSRRNEATIRAVAKRLQGLGFTISTEEIQARNVAVVMVTSRLPAFSRPGHSIDIEVSSTGDATSLEGGVLQLTPLYAANGQAYATAQGPLVVGGYLVEQSGAAARKNHPTVGRVPDGAVVERENPNRLEVNAQTEIQWIIDDPDFGTARALAEAVNTAFDEELARPRDAGTVVVSVPRRYLGRVVGLVAEIEMLEFDVELPARIVVNERTGTVVMGDNVRIAPVAVAHGGLTIQVMEDSQTSQPGALSDGRTVTTPKATIKVDEEGGDLQVIDGVTIGDLVNALNNMGVKPRDLIQILMSISAAGALQAELIVQ